MVLLSSVFIVVVDAVTGFKRTFSSRADADSFADAHECPYNLLWFVYDRADFMVCPSCYCGNSSFSSHCVLCGVVPNG